MASGSILTNPWELSRDEVTASDVVTLDSEGNIIDSDWNVAPAIGVHLQLHALRPDAHVVIHNHAHWGGIWANLQKVPPVYDQAGISNDEAIELQERLIAHTRKPEFHYFHEWGEGDMILWDNWRAHALCYGNTSRCKASHQPNHDQRRCHFGEGAGS